MAEEKHPREEGTINALNDIKDSFDKFGVVFILDFGTLLGAVRHHGKMIPWECDTDISMLKDQPNYDKLFDVLDDIKKKGFEVCYFGDRGMIMFRRKDTIHTTIHLLEIEDEYATFMQTKALSFKGKIQTILWWLLTAAKDGGKKAKYIIEAHTIIIRRHGGELQSSYIPTWLLKGIFRLLMFPLYLVPNKEKVKKLIMEKSKDGCKLIHWRFPKKAYTDLTKIEFYGRMFDAPKDPASHFAFMYGDDWMTPKRDWDDLRDDISVKNGISTYNMPDNYKQWWHK